MTGRDADYVPALAYDKLTSLYDPVVRVTTRERAFKNRLLEQAVIQSGHRILDLGCGTATLTISIKQRYSGAEVVDLDGDPKILSIARTKAQKAGVELELEQGMSSELPYADGEFDRVLSSLLFHHLNRASKVSTFNEAFRVLRAGGELHVADWGKAGNPLMRGLFFFVQLLDGFETTADNVRGMLPELMKDAGFESVRECSTFTTILGTLSLYMAKKAN